jgi:SAM-dependent methyltransferase
MSDDTGNSAVDARQYWDAMAESFDEEPDHGLREPGVLQAWAELLRAWLPGTGMRVLDMGCGTGSLGAILAGFGHDVTGADFSREMLGRARSKTAGLFHRPAFCVMDATRPAFAARSFDIVVCRHVLWALPQREQVLARWADLLRPGGRLVLIEGYWSTGSGVRAQELVAELPFSLALAATELLSSRPELWGKHVTDERYAVIADRAR